MFTKTRIIFRKIFQNSKVNKDIYVANKKKYNETTSTVVINKIITRKMHTRHIPFEYKFGGGGNGNKPPSSTLWLIVVSSIFCVCKKKNDKKNNY
jgi:hypothetical protein